MSSIMFQTSKVGDNFLFVVYDGKRRVVSGMGKTVGEAMAWALHHLDRIGESIEKMAEQMGLQLPDELTPL